jgi:hypothetical protein
VELLKGYMTITGILSVNENADVENLESLEALTEVGGNLFKKGTSKLSDISGVKNLTKVGGCFEIMHNRNLLSSLA